MANNFEKATQIMNTDNRSPSGDSVNGTVDADDPGFVDPLDLYDGTTGVQTTTDEFGNVHLSQSQMHSP